jgi:hypothetical protein
LFQSGVFQSVALMHSNHAAPKVDRK